MTFLDKVEFECGMADRAVWAAATMRKANQRCADRAAELDDSGDPCKSDDSWRWWNGERAMGAAWLLAVWRVMRKEGYAFSGARQIGEFLSETYRDMLRYEREIHLSERSAKFDAAIRSAMLAAERRVERAEATNPFSGMGAALDALYDGVDTRRLIGLYVDDNDIRGLDLPEAFALAPQIWRHYINGTSAA